jgi:hypothetical protein
LTPHSRLLLLGSLVVGSCLVASADSPVRLLQNQLNSVDYNLVDPASSGVVAGGFVVADNKHASYNGLPSGVTFPTNASSASFFGSTGSRSFNLQALLSSIATIASGGLSINRTSQLTVDQINASAQTIDTNVVIANQAVANFVKTWISMKYSVYIVDTAMSTASISISSSSSTDIAGAFGTKLPSCPTGTGTTGAKLATGGTETSASPTASLQACLKSSSEVTLSSATPLVVATSLRPVTLQNGNLFVGPVSQIVKGGQVAFALEGAPPRHMTVDWNPTHAKPGFH